MAQMTKAHVITAALLAGLVIAGIPAWAQTNAPANGMMRGGDGMKPGMMMDPDMQQKMSRMIDNCNRMMESMMPKDGASPPVPNKG